MGLPLGCYSTTYNVIMPHFDLSDVSIKTEPLSPSSTDDVMAHITSSDSPPSTSTVSTPSPHPYADYSQYHSSGTPAIPYMRNSAGEMDCQSVPCSTPTDTRSALKSTIINRRKARGEMSLPSTEEPPIEYKLTKREIERKETRKEQNRRAARRCRQKKKIIQLEACKEMQMAMKENVNMKSEVQSLREQVHQLQHIILQHVKTDKCKMTPPDSLCTAIKTPPLAQAEPDENRLATSFYVTEPEPPKETETTTLTPSAGQHLLSKSPCRLESDDRLENIPEDLLRQYPEILQSTCPNILDLEWSFMPDEDFKLGNFCNDVQQVDTAHSTDQPESTYFDLAGQNGDCQNLPDEGTFENIQDIIAQAYTLNRFDSFETPKVEAELNQVENNLNTMKMSYPPKEDTPKNYAINSKTDNFKPRVVRDLNRDFLLSHADSKNTNIVNNSPPVNLVPSLDQMLCLETNNSIQNDVFLDRNLISPPIFNFVPPNLIQHQQQQPTVVVSNPSYSTSPPPSSDHITRNAQMPFQNFTSKQSHTDAMSMSIPDGFGELSSSLCHGCDSSTFKSNSTSIPAPTEFLITDSYSTDSSINTSVSNTNTTNNDSDSSNYCRDFLSMSNTTSDTSSFQYQLSPISTTSSPSSVSELASPGFLQSSPYGLCNGSSAAMEFNF